MYRSKKASQRIACPASVIQRPDPRPISVLYISFTGQASRPYLDPSTRYRCFYPVEAARALGHRAFVAAQGALATADPSLFDMVVVHRPAFTPDLVRFLRAARAAGTRLVADYDDLIFDPAYAAASSMFESSWDVTNVFATFERNTDALRLFGEFTVSTVPLRDHILSLHPGARVQVLPNAVSPSLWSLIAARGYHQQPARPYVGYFPGTATHNADFAVAAEGVAELCRTRRIPLRVVGPMQADDAVFRGITVERTGLQPFSSMFDTLSSCRVVIAPLTPSPFNRAKSHIKLVEALLSCTACVATSIPDMAQHCTGTDSALQPAPLPVSLVEDAGDWAAALGARWDGYDLAGATVARDALVRQFGAARVYAPLFGAAA